MLLFVLDVGLKKFFGFDREVFLQCILDKVTNRDLQVAEGQSPKHSFFGPFLEFACLHLHGSPGTFTSEKFLIGVHSAQSH